MNRGKNFTKIDKVFTKKHQEQKKLQDFFFKVFCGSVCFHLADARGLSEGRFVSTPGRAKRVQGGFFQPPPKIWVFLGFLGQYLGGRQPNTPFP